MKQKILDLLVIIPCHNEEKTIGDVIKSLLSFVNCFDILVVDDGSTDNSKSIASKLGVNIISNNTPSGVGGAMIKGWFFFLQTKYKYWIQYDGDGQFISKYLPRLYKAINDTSVDLVIGTRFNVTNFHKGKFIRKIGNIFFSKITNLLIQNNNVTDVSSGYRIGTRKLAYFLSRNYLKDHPDSPMIIKMSRNGFKISEVPITTNPRNSGISILDSPIHLIRYPIISIMHIIIEKIRLKVI